MEHIHAAVPFAFHFPKSTLVCLVISSIFIFVANTVPALQVLAYTTTIISAILGGAFTLYKWRDYNRNKNKKHK